jgi:L-Ala-D/L-Glu epimerase
VSLRLAVAHYELPFARPVATARGLAAVRRGAIVRLEGGGHAGYAEVASWPGFGSGPEVVEAALARIGELRLPPGELDSKDDIDAYCRALAAPPELQAALGGALLDRLARRRGLPLAGLFAAEPARAVAVGALVRDAAEARARVAEGVLTLKLKLGAAPIEVDLARVREVRGALGGDVRLRADANRAYSLPDALTVCGALTELGIDYVEEPLRTAGADELARLRSSTGVRLALDESLTQGEGERLVDPACCDVLVLKPGFVGGPLGTARWVARARALGMGVVIGTAFESAVGLATALQLAAALTPDSPAGISSVLARDLSELPAAIGGRMSLPLSPGIGVTPRLAGWV